MEVFKRSILQTSIPSEHFHSGEHALNFLTIVNDSEKEYISFFTDLLTITQTLCGQTVDAAKRFCLEVANTTQKRAHLVLVSTKAPETESTASQNVSASFPVSFQKLGYGMLYIAFDPTTPTQPALPLDIAYLLAQVCGLLLYTLEVTALIRRELQPDSIAVYSSLTRRQREILFFVMRGYDQDKIAEQLSISPATVRKHMQNIYQELGVHSEREAILAAYQAGLISPICDLPPHDA